MFCLIWLQLCCVGRRTVGAKPQHLSRAEIWVALKMRGRNPCIWQSYMDRFCPKWATWRARVVAPPTPHTSRTLVHTVCSQHPPYGRSYWKGTGENQDTSVSGLWRERLQHRHPAGQPVLQWGSTITCRLIQGVWLLTRTAVKPLSHSG